MEGQNTKEKRKRGINWLEDDKQLLQELVKRDVTRIENKNTDTNSNKEKQNAWSELTESFNQICVGTQRTVDQLKKQWSAIKIQARKTVSERRKAIKATGGGPPPQDAGLSECDISVWLPNEFVTDSNKFDSDAAQIEFLDEEAEEALDIERQEKELSEVEVSEVKDVQQGTKKMNSKKRKKSQGCSLRDEGFKNIAEVETSCRLQLHEVQMERERLQMEKERHMIDNERKRSKILDVELELKRAKLRKEVGTSSEY